MSFKVTIEFKGNPEEVNRYVEPIGGEYAPDNSYIESKAFVDGVDGAYGKSVYATKTHGMGTLPLPEPYASTGIPTAFPTAAAKIHLAVVGEDNKVEFTTDDYKEAFYYKELAAQLASQGFEITVEDTEEGGDDEGGDDDPVVTPSISLNKETTTLTVGGDGETLVATVVPSDAVVDWDSSDDKVATVEGGVLAAVAVGEATITAKITVKGIEYTATCGVTVTE